MPLTEKQKKLPAGLQKAILAKDKKAPAKKTPAKKAPAKKAPAKKPSMKPTPPMKKSQMLY
jgi:hypothetical protein